MYGARRREQFEYPVAQDQLAQLCQRLVAFALFFRQASHNQPHSSRHSGPSDIPFKYLVHLDLGANKALPIGHSSLAKGRTYAPLFLQSSLGNLEMQCPQTVYERLALCLVFGNTNGRVRA
ncbi:unnamed protein product [Rhizoctonia solani]|uniref:Uncharacterized protein n=1 Tax=Rhizoctonia solani TaxID=456999 RepID=A0A8H2ZUG9_9AGAM|nr:unnamed protein product [Rhizoctonia solani]